MNHCAIQQQNTFSACEVLRSPAISKTVADRRDHMVCPKPRRISHLHPTVNDPVRHIRCHLSYLAEASDSKVGNDLLDVILLKGGVDAEQFCTQAASSPPIFSGSPPSRVSNPIVQDSRFGDEEVTPNSPPPLVSSSPSSARKGGGCVRANFGNNPAVRIEGFDCLDRDRHNCSIPALA